MLGTFVAQHAGRDRVGGVAAGDRAHPAWAPGRIEPRCGLRPVRSWLYGAAAVRGFWPGRSPSDRRSVLLAVFAGLWQRGPSRVAWRGWAHLCGVTVFVLLLRGRASVVAVVPSHLALRGQVRRQRRAGADRQSARRQLSQALGLRQLLPGAERRGSVFAGAARRADSRPSKPGPDACCSSSRARRSTTCCRRCRTTWSSCRRPPRGPVVGGVVQVKGTVNACGCRRSGLRS